MTQPVSNPGLWPRMCTKTAAPRRERSAASRAARVTQSDVARVIKGAQKAKLQIAAVRIEPDGTILVIPGAPEIVQSSKPNPWDGEA